MHLLVYDPSGTLDDRVCRSLSSRWPVEWIAAWSGIHAAREADTVVMVLPRLARRRIGRVTEVRSKRPSVGLVLVTRRRADHLRRICRVTVDAVVWTSEVDGSLTPAVRRAADSRLFDRLADATRRRVGMPPILGRALDLALRAHVPYSGVGSLAEAVGRDRRTLWYHWRRLAADEAGLHLGELLTWIRILRAAALKERGWSWARVARHLDTPQRTLREQVRRFLGWTLGELARQRRRDLWRRFVRRMEEGSLDEILGLDHLAEI